jgi:Mn-dependent DtxR family transcriptional regulator
MEHEIEMAGATVVRIEDRRRGVDERIAEREVDRLFEAFNNQDTDALSAFFGDEGRSPATSPHRLRTSGTSDAPSSPAAHVRSCRTEDT